MWLRYIIISIIIIGIQHMPTQLIMRKTAIIVVCLCDGTVTIILLSQLKIIYYPWYWHKCTKDNILLIHNSSTIKLFFGNEFTASELVTTHNKNWSLSFSFGQ